MILYKILFFLQANVPSPSNSEEAVFPVEDYGPQITKVFFMLLLLIGLLILTAWLLKRFLRFRMQASSVGQSIQILEKKVLSPKSILYLVEVEKQKFLVSESQAQVQKIDSIQEKIE